MGEPDRGLDKIDVAPAQARNPDEHHRRDTARCSAWRPPATTQRTCSRGQPNVGSSSIVLTPESISLSTTGAISISADGAVTTEAMGDVNTSAAGLITLEARPEPPADAPSERRARLPAMPREAPLAMPAQAIYRFSRRGRRKWKDRARAHPPWLARLAVFGGALALSVFGAREMYGVVSVGQVTALEWALVVLFVINFSWVALAFTTSVVGFFWLIARPSRAGPLPETLSVKTAVVMPIYNEASSRVFAALQAIEESVAATLGLVSTSV